MILEDNPGRRPQTFGGAVYLVVVAMTLTGLAITLAGAWRTGVSWIGAGLLVGSSCRLVLPERRAGMLRVRRKASDVVMLAVAGVALMVLAVVVPEQLG
ncbi:DUF3017 domain-containing protein [Nocardioides sp. WL0053]|uniref:DUF3017 domain-containing protein n=1 Tax=Nocardioides jiangsuensis TaxID=2866161 RepID=A0ABS7RPB3_9ACTN|nr:DUF3017 domain-containing protein [Nocardioides jiangsuensis]MBY9076347.1 DUF3017 domain-containing protein [Nocardioides jiangsuensis]